MASKSPNLLTPAQRQMLTQIPDGLSERDIAYHYTLTDEEIALARRRQGPANKLGFALQIAALRFPGRPLSDLDSIPEEVLAYVASQMALPLEAFFDYGRRQETLYEHLALIRQRLNYQNYDGTIMLALSRQLMPLALESDEQLPLVEAALDYLRTERAIAPAIGTIEGLVWRVLRTARRITTRWMLTNTDEALEARLDQLLVTQSELGRRSLLAWLRVPPGAPTARHLHALLDRIDFLEELELPPLSPHLHPNRIRQLAHRCQRYEVAALARLASSEERYALLVAHLTDLYRSLLDDSVDMFDRILSELMRKGQTLQRQQIQEQARSLHENLHTLADAADAFLLAWVEDLDPFETVFRVVDRDELAATVDQVRNTARPRNLNYLDLIETRYVRRRQAFLRLVSTLDFEPVSGEEPSLEALSHVMTLASASQRVRAVEQRVRGQVVVAPLTHITSDRWRRHVQPEAGTINPNFYELAAFDRLKGRVRAGDVVVPNSRRYQSFESHLLSSEHWQELQATQQTRLAVGSDPDVYLQTVQHTIETRFQAVEQLFEQGDTLKVNAEGKLWLDLPESDAPPDVKAWREYIYRILPRVHLPDLLIEVDQWTGFLDHFRHLVHRTPTQGADRERLIAGLMGLGMNVGLERMAQATPYSFKSLSSIRDWYLRAQTQTQAQVRLDNFALHQLLSQAWGDGTTSSSDGIRIPIGVGSVQAGYYPHRLGYKRAVSVITHVADVWIPFGFPVITSPNREALHVIDALCHHESELNILEHYTDEGGASYHVFALCHLLGFRFAPHLKQVAHQVWYTVDRMDFPPPFAAL